MTNLLLGLGIGILVTYVVLHLQESKQTMPDSGWWTVFGIWADRADFAKSERYSLHVQADNARGAEDLAQWEAKEKGGELWVATVLEGKLVNQDGYATFVDPDIKPTDWMNTDASKMHGV